VINDPDDMWNEYNSGSWEDDDSDLLSGEDDSDLSVEFIKKFIEMEHEKYTK